MMPKKQENICIHCGKAFEKLTTLNVHMCVKKRRHMEIDTPPSRFGFMTFLRFYELTVRSKRVRTKQEFIDSPYYTDFVKFGNHIVNLKPLYVEKFIDFVIMNGVKLKDWTKDFVYELYIEDLIKKEPCDTAAERSITEISEWCNKNNKEFKNFFNDITANEAAYMIKTGKISPWVFYLCETGDSLMNRFNEDHSNMIAGIIEPGFWMKKFKKSSDDVEFMRKLLTEAGL